MSGLTGKGQMSIKKKEVAESRVTAVGFKKVRFLHEMDAGEDTIILTALVAPTGAVGYSAPSLSDLSAVNLLQFPGNVELVSSSKGRLIQNLSYVISGSSTIKLLYEADDGEIIEGTIDQVARTGNTLVDGQPLVVTGTLSAGNTDFNVGEPFTVGKFPLAQHGAVVVFLDNQLMYRNTGNNPPGAGVEGDYYEVHAGAGLGTIIRFNTPDLVNDRSVSVMSVGALVERPDGSQMAMVESVQGQIDAMVPTLAALAGVPETTFQATPNNVDLKAFGDIVIAQQATITALLDVEVPVYQEYAAAGFSSFSSNNLYIPVYGTVRYSRGAAIGIISNTAADGWSFTALMDCNVTISASSGSNAGFGFSVNASASEMDNPVFNLAGTAKIYGYTSFNTSGLNVSAASIPLVAGDVLRVHSQDLITAPNVNMGMIATARMKLQDLAGL